MHLAVVSIIWTHTLQSMESVRSGFHQEKNRWRNTHLVLDGIDTQTSSDVFIGRIRPQVEHHAVVP